MKWKGVTYNKEEAFQKLNGPKWMIILGDYDAFERRKQNQTG